MISDSHMFLSCRYRHLLENHKKRRQQKFRDGYTRGKTKEKKRASEQLYKVSDKSPCPSFLQSVLPAKAWRAIFTFRQKKKKKFIFKPLTLLLSAHFFSLSSSPWQTLNCLWKVLGTTFPRIWKKYQQCPLSSRLQSYTAGWQEYWYKCLEEQFGNILARALELCISFGPISHLLES